MKNAKHTIVLAALVLFALPFAQYVNAAVPPPGEDLFGMYADNNFNDDASDENPTFVIGDGVIQVYIYLTNVSAPAIGAFDFALVYTGGSAPIVVDEGLPPEGVNYSPNPNEYIVGVGIPLVPDQYGHAILMSPTYFVGDADPVYVSVTPTSIPVVPNQIVYVEFDDVSFVHFMNPASGNFVDPIFAFNTGLVAIASATWTAVKGLYR